MATIYQMPKVSRRTKLQAPAPLKSRGENQVLPGFTDNKTDTTTISTTDSTDERKENLVISSRRRGSARTLRLEKPQPLKTIQTDRVTSVGQDSSDALSQAEIEAEKRVSPRSAHGAACRLIEEVLQNAVDIQHSQNIQHTQTSSANTPRTKLLSQVSRDSGFEEMGSFSRQGSMLDSLQESYVDDLIYDEIINDVFDEDQTSTVINGEKYSCIPNGFTSNSEPVNKSVIRNKYEEDVLVHNFKCSTDYDDLMIPRSAHRTMYPEDLDMIEAELAYMRDTSADCEESLCSVEETKREVVEEECEVVKEMGKVVMLRTPISPITILEDIQDIELEMPTGHYSAKGRRRMFRNLKMITQEQAVPSTSLLQYSVEELLEIGSHPVCHGAPESWAFLVQTLPDVCFQESHCFDTLHYREERSYVEEHVRYVRESSIDKNNHNQRQTGSSEFNLDTKCDVRVRGGGFPSSASFSTVGMPSVNQKWKPTGRTPTQNQPLTEKCPW